jgi:mandelamide amidase
MIAEAATWSLTTALGALRAGRLSAEEYLTDLLAHERSHGGLGAYITPTGEQALVAARAADRSDSSSSRPLHGVPLVVKDNIDVAEVPTTAAMPRLRDHVPFADSAAWRRLAGAGALLLGKTSMHELAFGVTGACTGAPTALNPVDLRYLAGGSSSGTAAAVAGGLAPAGLGTDTGGSARIPAAVCGITGFRPTTGRYPHEGVLRIAPSRDTIGLMARDVEDLLLLDAVLTSRDITGMPPLASPPQPPRLAVPEPGWSGLDSEVDRVASAALTTLQRCGCVLVKAGTETQGGSRDLLLEVATTVPLAETPEAVTAYLAATGSTVTFDEVVSAVASPDVRNTLTPLTAEPARTLDRYRAALAAEHDFRTTARAARRALGVSASVMPTTILPAAPVGVGEHVLLGGTRVSTFLCYIRNTAPAAILSLPSVTIPAGTTAGGLPVGLQLDGHPHADTELLRLALHCSRLLGTPRTLLRH